MKKWKVIIPIIGIVLVLCILGFVVKCNLTKHISNDSNPTTYNNDLEHDHSDEPTEPISTEESTEPISTEEIDMNNHTHEYTVGVTKEATCLENGSQTYTCKCGDSYDEEIPALGHDYVSKTVAPTYEAKGYTEHTCSRCGDTYRDEYVDQLVNDDGTTPVHKHEYKSEITKPVSCLVAGEKTYTCECGDTYTEKIPAIGHTYKTEKINATCTERGYTTHTCKECGYSYSDTFVAALGHNYGSWKSFNNNEHEATCTRCGEKITEAHKLITKVTKQAACTTEGTKTHSCSCGYSFTETIAALGHNYTSNVVKPTATERGYTDHTCTRCGDSYRDQYTQPTGSETTHTHSYKSSITKEATCTTDGVRTYVCDCGDKYTEPIKATGHNYNAVKTEPTCTERGYTTHICSKCGDSYVDNYVAAKGHTYDAGKVTKAATCSAEGIRTYTCTKCGSTRTESIAKIAHTETTNNAKAATCITDGYSGDKVCSVCGELLKRGYTIAATGHSWNSGTITKQPTCTAAGTRTYTCTKCNQTKTESIAATGHQHTEIRNKKDATCTTAGYTGDTHCKDCGAKLQSGTSIAATGHSYGSWTKQDDNKHVRTCSKCGATETSAHTWNSGVVTKDATCKETGIKTYTCTACGHTKTETIPKTNNHTWDIDHINKIATCTEPGEVVYKCIVCGTTKTESTPKDPNNHDYQCTHEAWDEQVAVYATCGITRWYVYYNPYPAGDPRRFDDSCTVYNEWTARDDFEDEVTAARSAYAAKLKEITDNGWLKKTGGYGGTGETTSYIAYYKTVHHDAEYTCSRCGKVKP